MRRFAKKCVTKYPRTLRSTAFYEHISEQEKELLEIEKEMRISFKDKLLISNFLKRYIKKKFL